MLSRYGTIQPIQLAPVPALQIPLELLQAKLAESQLAKDEYDVLSSQMPNYLKEDAALAGKYKALVDKVSSDVSQAFASGKTGDAMRLLQQGKQYIAKQWMPNGIANALNQRYNQDIAVRKQIEDTFANDVKSGNSINYQLAKSLYKIPEANYNPNTGEFTSIGAPNVPTFFDYRKEMLDYVKAAKPEIKEISKIQGDYIWDEKGQQYHVPGIMQGFMADPRVQQQIGIESQFQLSRMSPEEQQAYADKLTEAQKQKYGQVVSEMGSIEQLLKSTDKEKRREGQAKLKELGLYTGKLDGDIGPKSLAAIDGLRGQVANSEPTGVAVQDLPGIFSQQAASKLMGTAESMLPDQYSLTVNQANWRAKLNAQAAKQKELMREFMPQYQPETFPVTSIAQDVNKVQEAAELAEKNYLQAKTAVEQAAPRFGFKNVEELVAARNNPQYAKLFSDNRGLVETIDNMVESKKNADLAAGTNQKLAQVYIARNGVDKANNIIKKLKLDQSGITAEMLIANPAEASRKFEEFQKKNNAGLKFDFFKQPGSENVRNAVQQFSTELNEEIQKDIKANYDAYRTAIPTGLKDNSEQFKTITSAAKNGYFTGIPDEDGSFEVQAWNPKKNGWEPTKEGYQITDVAIFPARSTKGGVVIQMSGKSADSKQDIRKNVHIQQPEQNAFIKSWASSVVADGLNGQETPENMLLATRILYGTNEAGRVASPENGQEAGVQMGGYSYDKKVNVIESAPERPDIKLVTFGDMTGNKQYSVVREVNFSERQTNPNIMPVYKVMQEVGGNEALFRDSEYDAAYDNFSTKRALLSPDIKLMQGKRKPSEQVQVPIAQFLNTEIEP